MPPLSIQAFFAFYYQERESEYRSPLYSTQEGETYGFLKFKTAYEIYRRELACRTPPVYIEPWDDGLQAYGVQLDKQWMRVVKERDEAIIRQDAMRAIEEMQHEPLPSPAETTIHYEPPETQQQEKVVIDLTNDDETWVEDTYKQ